jgi:glutamate racemase
MLKIGVFDSGLGGLTVVKALSQVIRNAHIFYVADTKNAPYGEKTPEQILQYSLDITQYLIETHAIDALILACNTATSFAIKKLRELYPDLIIIGTEPGVKPALEQTKTGKIGILATPATLKGEKYQELVKQLSVGKDVVLYEQACPGLVEQIERGAIACDTTKTLLNAWLVPMKENSVDTIVLGCTHYPLVGEIIENIMDCDVALIETGSAIANRLLTLSRKINHENDGTLTIFIHHTDTINTNIIDSIISDYTLI